MKALIPIFLLCLILHSCEKETNDTAYCYRCETTMNDAVISYVTVCGVTNIADFQQGLQAQINAIFHEDCKVECTATNETGTSYGAQLTFRSSQVIRNREIPVGMSVGGDVKLIRIN